MKRSFKLSEVREQGGFVNVAPAYLQVGDRVRFAGRRWTVVLIDPKRDVIVLED